MDRHRAARVSSTAVPTEGLGALRASQCGLRAAGGAGLGAIQAGMLRALYAHGVGRDVIVGTSAGALNGAFIAR